MKTQGPIPVEVIVAIGRAEIRRDMIDNALKAYGLNYIEPDIYQDVMDREDDLLRATAIRLYEQYQRQAEEGALP